MPFYYLSFCDPQLPKGEQFIGATIVEASGPGDIVRAASAAARNPGGEIAFQQLAREIRGPDDMPASARKYFEGFVPRAEVLAADDVETIDAPVICQACNKGGSA